MTRAFSPSAAAEAGLLARPWPRALLLLTALILLALLSAPDVVASMARTWWLTTAFNHGPLVPLGSLWLAWRDRAALARLTPRADPLGLPLLAATLLGGLATAAAEIMVLQQAALVATIVALALTVLGRRVALRLAFPLGFLFMMVPVGEELIPPLQEITATFAVAVLRLVGIPVFREGMLITTPSGLFEVAEACAGLRFLIANVVIALLFAHLFYRRAWKWALFLTLSVVVPILANGLRATGIIVIAYLTDNEHAVGVDHLVYGWGFFVAVMLALLWLGSRFADPLEPPAAALPPAPAARAPAAGGVVLATALGLLVAAPAYAALVMRPPASVPPPMARALPAPAGWERREPGPWRPALAGTDLLVAERLVRDGHEVDVVVGWYAFQRPGSELVQARNTLADNEAWRRRGRGSHALAVPGLPPEVILERLITVDQRAQRVVLAWYWHDGRHTASAPEVLLREAWNRLRGRHAPAAIITVSAPYETGPEPALAAIAALLGSGIDLDRLLVAPDGPAAR
jgi:exosortase A